MKIVLHENQNVTFFLLVFHSCQLLLSALSLVYDPNSGTLVADQYCMFQ